MPENFEQNGLRRNREEVHESRSGSDNMDGGSGDDFDVVDNPPRKKRYHRHTHQLIQELESSLIASMSSTCSAFLNVYSTQPSAPPSAAGGGSEPAAIAIGSPSTPLTFDGNEQSSLQQIPYVQTRSSSLTSASTAATTNLQGVHSNDRSFASHSFPASQDRAHPSEQSLSDSLRSRFNAVSMRYDFLETLCM
ncbi:hypothetical protein JHK82_025065 [Glycine max]|nr:hypothetical protein JHK82_025065 [Glycine max]